MKYTLKNRSDTFLAIRIGNELKGLASKKSMQCDGITPEMRKLEKDGYIIIIENQLPPVQPQSEESKEEDEE